MTPRSAEPWADYRPDLAELMALASGAGAWFGADPGPTHLAARCGAPTAALFGPTDLAWAPRGADVFPWAADPGELARWAQGAVAKVG